MSALWAEQGAELVVVGGSAVEFLTEGAYASGDLDMCHTAFDLALNRRQEIMNSLGAKGGPRNWQIAGMYLDLLGEAESFARTPFRRIEGPYGSFLVMKPEDLFVERVFVSHCTGGNEAARRCARILASVALRGEIAMDWNEAKRIANLPEYRNFPQCAKLLNEVADELEIQSPLHSD